MFAFYCARSLKTVPLVLAAAGAMAQPCWSDSPTSSPVSDVAQDNEATPLGVVIADSPGTGVLVINVAIGSPAHAAGINAGDFVLSVDGKPVEVPGDLVTAIRSHGADHDVKLGLWRAGKELTVATKLAVSGDDQRAWLGVALDGAFQPLDGTTRGAVIAQVLPGSPAEKAKLQVGDLVVSIGDQPIQSAEQLIGVIGKKKPREVIHLTVNRDGMETAYKIELGSLDATPPAFPAQRFPFDFVPDAFRTPEGDLLPRIPFGHVMRGEGVEDLKQQMNEFRTQLEVMRKQLRRLRRGDAESRDDGGSGEGEGDANDRAETDQSEASSQSGKARRSPTIDRLPTVYSDDFLAAPPYYGPYGYPQGFSLPQYNPYGFYGRPPYSGGFNVPWYTYPFNSPHIHNYFGRRLPYYYQRDGRFYYSRRPYEDRSLMRELAPSQSSESRSHQ